MSVRQQQKLHSGRINLRQNWEKRILHETAPLARSFCLQNEVEFGPTAHSFLGFPCELKLLK